MFKTCQIVFSYPIILPEDKTSFKNGNVPDFRGLPNFFNDHNLFMVNKNDYLSWEKEIGCRPNTGIISILDLLLMQPKELYITGFTLFKDGYSKLYRDKIDNKSVTEKNSKFNVLDRMYKAGYKGSHDQHKIYLYLKGKLLNNPSVKMDQELLDILNFNSKKYAKNNNLTDKTEKEIFVHYLYND